MWSEILVLLTTVTVTVYLFLNTDRNFQYVRFFLLAVLLSLVISFIPAIGIEVPDIIAGEWSRIAGITSLLIVLGMVIRELRPLYARHPASFSLTPAAIMIFYPFIADVEVLKDLLNQILQAGALVITFLLYLSLAARLKFHFVLLTGIGLFSAAYLLYWFSDVTENLPWMIHLFLSFGLLTVSYSFTDIFQVIRGNG
ncbi:MAG: hypothetical protein WEC12_00145 [Balneolaceae bacterium]